MAHRVSLRLVSAVLLLSVSLALAQNEPYTVVQSPPGTDGGTCDPRKWPGAIKVLSDNNTWRCNDSTYQWEILPAGTASAAGSTTGQVQLRGSGGALAAVTGYLIDSSTGMDTKILNRVKQAHMYATGGDGTWSDPYTGFSDAFKSAVESCIKEAWAANRYDTEVTPNCGIHFAAGVYALPNGMFNDFQIPYTDAISIPTGVVIYGDGPYNTIFTPASGWSPDADGSFWFSDGSQGLCSVGGNVCVRNSQCTAGGGDECEKDCDSGTPLVGTTRRQLPQVTFRDVGFWGRNNEVETTEAYCEEIPSDVHGVRLCGNPNVGSLFDHVVFTMLDGMGISAEGTNQASEVRVVNSYFNKMFGPAIRINNSQSVNWHIANTNAEGLVGNVVEVGPAGGGALYWSGGSIIPVPDCLDSSGDDLNDPGTNYYIFNSTEGNGSADGSTNAAGTWVHFDNVRIELRSDDASYCSEDGYTACTVDGDCSGTCVAEDQWTGLFNTTNSTSQTYEEAWRLYWTNGSHQDWYFPTTHPTMKVGGLTRAYFDNWTWYVLDDGTDDDADGYAEHGEIALYGDQRNNRGGYVKFENSTLPNLSCLYGQCSGGSNDGLSCTRRCDSGANEGTACYVSDSECGVSGETCDMDYDCPSGTCETVGCSDPLDKHPFLTASEMVTWYGRCSTTTTTFCEADSDCPGGETCDTTTNREGVYEALPPNDVAGGLVSSALGGIRFATQFRRGASGVGSPGLGEMQATKFKAHLKLDYEGWPKDDAGNNNRLLLMPYGAIITDVKCYEPASGTSNHLMVYVVGSCPYDSTDCDNDGTIYAQSAAEQGRFDHAINVEDQYVGPLTTYDERMLRLWAQYPGGQDTQSHTGGYCVVEYF